MASTSRQSEIEITNSFEGIAPSASSSRHPELEIPNAFEQVVSTSGRSRMPERKLPYDVFINHRGPDVKHTLAATLYKTLTGMGLRVFLDKEELELGDFLPAEIEEAMRSASLHIAILSQNYAQSPWCLAELSFMLKTGIPIIPIFYHVEPADVRYATGVYAEAFSRYTGKGRYTLEKIEEWKDALNNVSYNVGGIIHNEDDEGSLLKKIVRCVLKVIKNVPFVVANHPIGLDEILTDFERTTLQSASSHDNVRVVGIWGMGGSGKTTLAKHLYNQKYKIMEKSSFLLDVRDAASKSLLHNKQKKLLEDLGLHGVSIENIEEGKGILASRLRSVRVLIILDDVDNPDQLNALVPKKESLGWGSLIVVTTRELEVLSSWGISFIYKMKALDPSHAQQLFCWHAFLQSSPLQEFKDLVERFLNVCNGLPLSLKVFGAQLYGVSNKDYWKTLLHKISRILDKDIKDRLKISYDALDCEEKQIFLDTACFFIGMNKTSAIAIWDGSGWSGLHSWEKLLNKCLVELDDYNDIRMHDHLRDLGREIANNQSPSRLWSPQQIDQFINAGNGVQGISIRGVMATTYESTNKLEQFARCSQGGTLNTRRGSCSMALLCNLTRSLLGGKLNSQRRSHCQARSSLGLKIFHVEGKFNFQVLCDLSREMLWLRLYNTEQINLQSLYSLENLRVLELSETRQVKICLRELWKTDNNAPVQLRELVINNCSRFQGFPNSIGRLKHLKMIVVHSGNKMRSLPEEFCLLQSLERLTLTACLRLSLLPNSFGNLIRLGHLDLSHCENLSSLPSSFGDLRNLGQLDLRNCKNLSSLPSSFGNLKTLVHLDLFHCGKLSSLPSSFGNLKNLGHLDLSCCKELRKLPVSFKELRLLQHLDLSYCLSLTLESDIMENMMKLEYLNLENCEQLEELPRHITNQASLTELNLTGTERLRGIPVNIGQLSKLQSLHISSKLSRSLPTSLGDLSSLTFLSIRDSPKLECLPDSLGCLNLLKYLFIESSGVKSLPKSVRQLSNLQNLLISSCPIRELDLGAGLFTCLKRIELYKTEVSKISISEHCCPGLKTLFLHSNDTLKKIEVLPNTLQRIVLIGNTELDELPSFAQSSFLREFQLRYCYALKKIQGLEHCRALEALSIDTRWEDVGVESLERMERLRKVHLKAMSRSGVEGCIQSMQKCPKEQVIVCTRAVPDAVTRLKSFDFSNLFVVDSFANQKMKRKMNSFGNREMKSVLSLKWPSNARCTLLCYVVNQEFSQTSEGITLTLPFFTESSASEYDTESATGTCFSSPNEYDSVLEAGKWVLMAVLQWPSTSRMYSDAKIRLSTKDPFPIKVAKAFLVTGEEERLVEAFTRLWALLSY
ncbi:hypothetical protein SUGI_0669290 [Cryptomeria japonica]|nr:hypothetical protein SUGI_0669290 [Cryptomeria japonica]